MNRLLIAFLFAPILIFSQQSKTESLILLLNEYSHWYKQPDSVLIICHEIKATDRKAGKAEFVNFYIIQAHFELGDSLTAVKLGSKYLPILYFSRKTRKSRKLNGQYQSICNDLYHYHFNQGNNKKASHYAAKIFKKYNYSMCGNGRGYLLSHALERMILCSEKLGKIQKTKRLIRKQKHMFSH